MTRAWTRSCAACSVRKGLIFLMLWSANLQDRAVFAMCFLKVSWSSKITPRFLTEADGVIVDEPNWIVKSCCRVGVAGKTRSSVFARLSCRWCSFICLPGSLRSVQLGVWFLAQGSHLSRGQFLPEPRFEPTTSGYKPNALSTRPRLPPTPDLMVNSVKSSRQIQQNEIWSFGISFCNSQGFSDR